ncbi:hypothetical protein hamaS1_10270 [Moorella sp. Hama-1]|nr:hypothetical protein hamaS1_10270 [Moorella sp. Hama-1]
MASPITAALSPDRARSIMVIDRIAHKKLNPEETSSENRVLAKMVATYSNRCGAGGTGLQAPVVLGEQT